MFIHPGRGSPATEAEHKARQVKLGKRTQGLGDSESKGMEFQGCREPLTLRHISLDILLEHRPGAMRAAEETHAYRTNMARLWPQEMRAWLLRPNREKKTS